MFGPRARLFTILGFDVKLDFSWVFIASLVVWSLATGYFPRNHAGLSGDTYWAMAVVSMLGLFFSIIFHELAHSLVARIYGLEIKGITLFIFGGMAEMKNDPANAETEFMMAIAGPLASFVLAGLFYLMMLVGAGAGVAIVAILAYLAFINMVLAIFNLIPAFPMDGGRVLRAVLWHYMGDLARATHIAARGGYFFGIALIALGAVSFFTGNIVSGIWSVLIGLFVQRAAAAEDFRSDVRSVFGSQPVRNIMTKDVIVAQAGISVQALVDDNFYRYYHDMFPVFDGDKLVGCVTVRDVKNVPRNSWGATTVGEIMTPCSDDNTIGANTAASDILTLMTRTNNGRMMVVENGQLVGVITLKDLLGVLTLEKELGKSG